MCRQLDLNYLVRKHFYRIQISSKLRLLELNSYVFLKVTVDRISNHQRLAAYFDMLYARVPLVHLLYSDKQ